MKSKNKPQLCEAQPDLNGALFCDCDSNKVQPNNKRRSQLQKKREWKAEKLPK